jgi:selenium-binding protein 1
LISFPALEAARRRCHYLRQRSPFVKETTVMNRREFIATSAAILSGAATARRANAGPGFASPAEAIKAPRETLLYVSALYGGTNVKKPDYLATVDVDPQSPTYCKVIHRVSMPTLDDELHHFGWNTCSSCHAEKGKERRYLILPGLKSSNIHIVDTADPKAPRLHKTIDGEVVKKRANLSAGHTVHCLADGTIMISMLGDAAGNGPGGFLLLDPNFDVIGRWEKDAGGMKFNYDFWYQPRHNVMVSSEWAAPKTYGGGFDPKDVEAGKYGSRLHFWDWKNRTVAQTIDLGGDGKIPLEVRFAHNPDSPHGFVGAALSSTVWYWNKKGDAWKADQVLAIPPIKVEGVPFDVPALITDSILSMDDRSYYFSNWLHGDVRQYDVSDPAKPKLAGQVWIGGMKGNGPTVKGTKLRGGPQMLQMSLDGKRLYVTNSLLSTWDNQFYPDMGKAGSHLLQIDCDTEKGGMKLNESFLVDFGKEPDGPARAHEMRYPGGDCTSDIFT